MARRVVDDVLGGRRAGSGGRVGRATVGVSGSRGGRVEVRTVVKANYRTVAKTGKNPALGRASAVMRSVEYMATRPDHSRVRVERDLVTEQGRVNLRDEGVRQQLLEQFTRSADAFMYRMVLSPGVENLSARQVEDWARRVLESNGVQRYVIVAHAGEAGHTSHPHAHVILPTDVRLDREAFLNLRVSGDRELTWERRLDVQLEQWWKGQPPSAGAQGGGARLDVDVDGDVPSERKPRMELHLE